MIQRHQFVSLLGARTTGAVTMGIHMQGFDVIVHITLSNLPSVVQHLHLCFVTVGSHSDVPSSCETRPVDRPQQIVLLPIIISHCMQGHYMSIDCTSNAHEHRCRSQSYVSPIKCEVALHETILALNYCMDQPVRCDETL